MWREGEKVCAVCGKWGNEGGSFGRGKGVPGQEGSVGESGKRVMREWRGSGCWCVDERGERSGVRADVGIGGAVCCGKERIGGVLMEV